MCPLDDTRFGERPGTRYLFLFCVKNRGLGSSFFPLSTFISVVVTDSSVLCGGDPHLHLPSHLKGNYLIRLLSEGRVYTIGVFRSCGRW